MSRFVFNRRTSATFAAAFFTAPLSRAHGAKGMDAPHTEQRTPHACKLHQGLGGRALVARGRDRYSQPSLRLHY